MPEKLEGTIHIVDDMPEIVTWLQRILANQGYTVQTGEIVQAEIPGTIFIL